MNRIYKFETINRVTSELYPEDYWRMGTTNDVKLQYIEMLRSPNLVPHITYLNPQDEVTFVVTLYQEGYDESNIVGRYKVWVMIRKLEMLEKNIKYRIRLIDLENGNYNSRKFIF